MVRKFFTPALKDLPISIREGQERWLEAGLDYIALCIKRTNPPFIEKIYFYEEE